MGRLRTWLNSPRRIPTNKAVLISTFVAGVARGYANYRREERISRLETRLARFEKAVIEAAKQSGKVPPRHGEPPRPKRRV